MFRITNVTTNIRARLIIDVYKSWLKKNANVLDLGCGDGIMSIFLKDALNIRITGCDIDNYLKESIPFKIMKDPSKLPFKKDTFDVVMLNDVLHHTSFENQLKIIKEGLRVAPKVFIFEVEPTPVGAASDYIINKFHNLKMRVPLTFRDHIDWQEILIANGMKVRYKRPAKPLFYPFTHEAFLVERSKK